MNKKKRNFNKIIHSKCVCPTLIRKYYVGTHDIVKAIAEETDK